MEEYPMPKSSIAMAAPASCNLRRATSAISSSTSARSVSSRTSCRRGGPGAPVCLSGERLQAGIAGALGCPDEELLVVELLGRDVDGHRDLPSGDLGELDAHAMRLL